MDLVKKIVVALVLMALLVVTVIYAFDVESFQSYRRLQHEYERIVQATEDLTKENQQLAVMIQALKANPSFKKKIIREELKMLEPGEVIYTFTK